MDWLAARVTGAKTSMPWRFRLHDTGDLYSVEYTQAWRLTMEIRPECGFWFYTRSFADNDMLEALTQLAALPNCQGWLSADSQNYMQALKAYCFAPQVWKVALMQESLEDMPEAAIEAVKSNVPDGNVVNFPCHRAGRHVRPVDGLFACPQVLGVYPLQPKSEELRPCQICSFCLPDFEKDRCVLTE